MLNKPNTAIKRAIDSGEYTITEDGRVFHRGKELIINKSDRAGRLRVKIYTVKVFVHRLQAYKKFGNDLFQSGVEVHHKDENNNNNHFDNLELVSEGTHRRLYHSGENNKAHVLTWEQVRSLRKAWKNGLQNYTELSRIFGISNTNIKKIVLYERWKEPIDIEKQ